MKFIEEKRDIFTVNFDKYYIGHCISFDCNMSLGIAKPIKKKFELNNLYKHVNSFPTCILHNRVFNLITKEKYWHKPTYETLEKSLEKMKEIIIDKDIKSVVMPKIGCGLDRLSWDRVSNIIKKVFENIDIEILICII